MHLVTRFLAHLVAALFLIGTAAAGAADNAPIPLRDPYVPPSARPTVAAPATSGAALRAQVMAKLRQQFADADTTGRGRLTQSEAAARGFGLVSQHFTEIDVRQRGEVSFDDVTAYLKRQGADL